MSNFASGSSFGFMDNPMAMSAYMKGKADAAADNKSNAVSTSSNPMNGINDIYAQMTRDANERRRDSVLQATYEANRGLFPLVQDRNKTDRINERRRKMRIGKKTQAQMDRDEASRARHIQANKDKKALRAERKAQRLDDETQRLAEMYSQPGYNASAAAVARSQGDKNESFAYQQEQEIQREKARVAAEQAEKIKAGYEAELAARRGPQGMDLEPQADIDNREAQDLVDQAAMAEQMAMEAEVRRQQRIAGLQSGQLTPEQMEVQQAGYNSDFARSQQRDIDGGSKSGEFGLPFIDSDNYFAGAYNNLIDPGQPGMQTAPTFGNVDLRMFGVPQAAEGTFAEGFVPDNINVTPSFGRMTPIRQPSAPPPMPPRVSLPPSGSTAISRGGTSISPRPVAAGPGLPPGGVRPAPNPAAGIPRPTVAPTPVTHPSHYFIRGRNGVTRIGTQGMSPAELNMLRIRSARDGLL